MEISFPHDLNCKVKFTRKYSDDKSPELGQVTYLLCEYFFKMWYNFSPFFVLNTQQRTILLFFFKFLHTPNNSRVFLFFFTKETSRWDDIVILSWKFFKFTSPPHRHIRFSLIVIGWSSAGQMVFRKAFGSDMGNGFCVNHLRHGFKSSKVHSSDVSAKVSESTRQCSRRRFWKLNKFLLEL